MASVKMGAAHLRRGNTGIDPEEVAVSARYVVSTKWFIAVSVVLTGRRLGLVALTPYFNTFSAAERDLEETKKEYPKAEILSVPLVFDLEDESQVDELVIAEQQTAVEREQEGYQ